uniref:DNA uptake protein n=1 Tax=Cyanothece sp. (strain PCC 7425 / ATCC 29141) TaxID=395961 RepID=B8HKM4_CYAP4
MRFPLLRSRLQIDPYYRFQTLAEVQQAAALGVRIDVNKAAVDDWLRLPGISIHQARTLVQLTQNGVQLYCLEDLAAVLDLSLQRLAPLAPILQFCYYDPASLSPQRLNPNTASIEQLQQLPGIDAALAHQITRERLAIGPYRHLADFQQRLDLPGGLINQLLPYLRF